MSVINKMLNDLEHRQSEQSIDGIDSKYRPPEKKVLTSKQMVAIGAVVVIVIFIGLTTWFSFNYFSNQSDSSNATKIANTPDGQEQDSPTKAATIVRNPAQFEQKEQAIQKLMDAESKKQQVSSSFDNVANSNSSPVIQESVTPVVTPPETVKTVTVAKKPVSNLPEARTQSAQEKPKPKPKATNSERTASPQFKIEKSSTTLTAQQRIDSWMAKAKESFEKGYITDAVENLNKILALSDSHVEARNLLAAAWYGRGDPKRAVGIINDGLNRYPNKSEWRLTAAKIFFKENN